MATHGGPPLVTISLDDTALSHGGIMTFHLITDLIDALDLIEVFNPSIDDFLH